jgi:hypothetical protein
MDIILGISPPRPPSLEYATSVRNWVSDFYSAVSQRLSLMRDSALDIMMNNCNSGGHKAIAFDFLATQFGFPRFSQEEWENVVALKRYQHMPSWATPDPERLSDRFYTPSNTSEMLPIIKAIRRYLFRRYARYHRKCLAKLRALTYENWCRLDSSALCPCALAYVLVAGNQFGRTPHDFLSARSPLNKYNTENSAYDWDYIGMVFKFYELWAILRSIPIGDYNILPFMNNYPVLIWNKIPGVRHSASCLCSFTRAGDIMFMENPEEALSANKRICAQRSKLVLSIDHKVFKRLPYDNSSGVCCVIYQDPTRGRKICDIYI